ncbi:unnamed protein product [Hyaloperonospora brassicae]|uniref:SCP domain-containing protein n=1 Tax=Hyaloperonospora brassicae TaxID=162125 RepID=A0AAV0UXP7_HYABA|nr:unnamed protein product [Hyaloperonospora brassicae]
MTVACVARFSIAVFACVATVHSLTFDASAQALWLDRFNYFRSTGLPWSAGNMRRLGWSSRLAASAQKTAATCAMETSKPNVILYQSVNSTATAAAPSSSSSSSLSLIDDAIQQWVVTTSLATLPTLTQPGAARVGVGKGTYNSYSQVLWATTTSVGCAAASCSHGAKEVLACEFAPAGNDGTSAWYVHAEAASECPEGTTASQGFCIVEGDAANAPIAPIPAGMLTYQVYPAYVATIQTVLIEAARALASGNRQPASTPSATSTTAAEGAPPPLSSSDPPAVHVEEEGDSVVQTATLAEEPSPSSAARVKKSRVSARSISTPTETGETSTEAGETPTEAGETADSTDGAVDQIEVAVMPKTYVSKPPVDSEQLQTSPKTYVSKPPVDSEQPQTSLSLLKKQRVAPDTVTANDSPNEASDTLFTKSDKTTMTTSSAGSFEESIDDQILQTSSTWYDESSAPGTVKASDDVESNFTNQEAPTQSELPRKGEAPGSSTSTPSPAVPPGKSAAISPGAHPEDTATGISNQSSGVPESGFSAAGIAGIVVLAVAGIAGVAIVMSYKKNQRRQREIMRDGGIQTI